MRNSFWSYELCKRLMNNGDESPHQEAIRTLLCGGIAGVATWASVFPLDVIKTRLQAQPLPATSLLATSPDKRTVPRSSLNPRPFRVLNALELTRVAYRTEGPRLFYRGLGICSLRAFIVNAIQVWQHHLFKQCITDSSSGQLMNGL